MFRYVPRCVSKGLPSWLLLCAELLACCRWCTRNRQAGTKKSRNCTYPAAGVPLSVLQNLCGVGGRAVSHLETILRFVFLSCTCQCTACPRTYFFSTLLLSRDCRPNPQLRILLCLVVVHSRRGERPFLNEDQKVVG